MLGIVAKLRLFHIDALIVFMERGFVRGRNYVCSIHHRLWVNPHKNFPFLLMGILY